MTSSGYSAGPDALAPNAPVVLALDTSSPSGGLALLSNGRLVAERTVEDVGTHSTWLPGAIGKFLEETGTSLGSIGLYATAVGPGSFTGIRIGVATVKALAWVYGARVYGASTLAAISLNEPDSAACVCPVLDARKGQVYAALFGPGAPGTPGPGEREILLPEGVFTPGELVEEVKGLAQGPVVFLGEGVDACGPGAFDGIEGARISARTLWRARAANVARMAEAAKSGVTGPELLSPVYLRKTGTEFKKAK